MSSAHSSKTKTAILDLPVDILLLIFPYLDAASFLSLTATCSDLHRADFVCDSAFWSALVRRDFRVPNQPVVQNDGERWQTLYKRLRTQSRIFTWGNNEKGCLGHSYESPIVSSGVGRAGRRVVRRGSGHVSFPSKMQGIEGLGVISDLQCGGWSTTLLTSKGALYTVGVLDGLQHAQPRRPYMQQVQTSPTALRFPPGMPQPKDRYDPATAVKQFSSGRGHVLALSDSGRIWSWQNVEQPGLHVKFIHHNTTENGQDSGSGVVKKVVAGWNKSAALIEGSGIVVWEPLQLAPEECDVADAALVLETAVVPRTRYAEPRKGRASGEADGDGQVGAVQNFILLSDCLVFNTSLGKAFAAQIHWSDTTTTITDPIELPIPVRKDAGPEASFVTDVQGSFQNFAVFTQAGDVLTSNQDRLMPRLLRHGAQQKLFQRIPALQNKQVISLAFGDYHFHALHSPGYITSYGNEPLACGALGLGGQGVPEGRLRGIRNSGIGGDGRLVPHAYTEGRRVWFEKAKGDWIKFLTSGGVDQQEAAERIRMAIGSPGIVAQGEISEWIEQEGRDWEGKFGVRKDGEEDDGLGAYFALSVSAAGWHSGALVLVNEGMAEKLRRAVEVPESEPVPIANEETPRAGPSITYPQPKPEPTSANPSFWDRAADYSRYFLGMAPYDATSAAYDPNASNLRSNATMPNTSSANPHHNPQPLNYGASPRDGYLYVWAGDHFPRLKLSDGTEMPGEVPFDEWRYGKPEWKLNWEDEQDEGAEQA